MRIERLENKVLSLLQAEPEARRTAALITSGLVLTAVLALAGLISGGKLMTGMLFVVPVGLITIAAGRIFGYLAAVLAAAIAAALATGEGGDPLLAAVNLLILFAGLMLFALLAGTLRDFYAEQAKNSRTDPLTGLPNIKSIRETLAREIDRCRRFTHPFSLAHVSCGDFREFYSRHGRAEADNLQRLGAECLRASLRNTDIVAKGFDGEFIALLPETDREAARLAGEKMNARLAEVVTGAYPGEHSGIGLISFSKCPYSFQEVLDMAELAMLEARRTGKIVTIAK